LNFLSFDDGAWLVADDSHHGEPRTAILPEAKLTSERGNEVELNLRGDPRFQDLMRRVDFSQ